MHSDCLFCSFFIRQSLFFTLGPVLFTLAFLEYFLGLSNFIYPVEGLEVCNVSILDFFLSIHTATPSLED